MKYDAAVNDLYLRLVVNFDITNGFLRYCFLLMGNAHLRYLQNFICLPCYSKVLQDTKVMVLCIILTLGPRSNLTSPMGVIT